MKQKLLMLLMGAFLFVLQAVAQQVTISGKVTSAEDGQPIPGATVRIKGTTSAVQTNVAGVYSIKANKGTTLQFVFLGTVTQERTIGDATTINVALKEDANSLKEVTVTTAYNVERDKKSIGYSLSKVDGDEVTQTGRENFVNGLAGRVPGLAINPTSGDPGASSQIVLRGIVSLSGDNQPLMVVDGVPIDNTVVNQMNTTIQGNNRNQDYTNRASDINPADIESYTILKGPEATALYGNLGANGAIVITTKKAKAGKASVSYNGSLRIETVNRAPEVQQVYSQGDANGIFLGGSTSYFGPKYSPGLQIYDNIGSFFRTGTAQKNNLVFEGGKESFTYRWSSEYVNNQGSIPNTEYKRFVTSLAGQAALSDAIKLTTRFSYTNAYNRKANKGLGGYLMGLLLYPSRYDINNWIDPLGNRVLTTGTIYTETDSPLWDVNKNLADDRTNSFLLNTNVTIKPNKWLNVTAIFGANVSSTDGKLVYHAQSYYGSGSSTANRGGVINTYNQFNKTFDGSLTASARHKFGKFNNTYIIGANASDVNLTTNSARGQNMYDPDFYSINNTLPTTQSARLAISRRRNAGVFAQAILGYEQLLYLTLSGRVDAASRMLPNNPYFAYPSASLAFNFSELEAVKKLEWLSSGKLRSSFGITGKEPYRYYALAPKLVANTTSGGGFSYDIAAGPNPDLVPEKTIDFEVGTELGFLKDRISVDFTYYQRESRDQIIAPRLSYGTGSVIRILNGGSVKNKGVEVQLKGSPLRKKDFNWDMTFNFTHNKGIVNTIAEELPEYYDSDTWIANGARGSTIPGKSTLAIGGWVNEKNNRGDLLINPSTGTPVLKSSSEFEYLGDRAPKFTLGYLNSFRYKNLTLSFLLDLRVGGDVYNQTEYELYRRGLSIKTLDREQPRIIKGVLKDGLENTANPTINNIMITPYTYSNYYSSTTGSIAPEQFLEKNIKTLRLRDVTIAYELPQKLAAKTGFITAVSLYVTFTDLFLITNYTGIDPDVNGNNPATGGAGGYGIDYGSMGRPRGVNMGLRIRL
ncbi:SusC/RagA family TonB-linked outer membrane protein [Pedobacter chitinilyticus]|uniref:SusC/RagA family TonB-linked outer membrane protein n=1 Tax=Pedobacter chitinilyticus TaxID=2233776 RepID=A0A3S3PNV3_9SPHI|nr:SusC/RagA family TonB-linked outer membrane protein [Pedobacter chitinilyticus]RWU07789.1 SusC/RagA family TonB-linked outer membrane protein [Pedobacter chitinilyticus]